MKKTKKNYVAIALVVVLLALAVGYAAFAQQLTITGTAKASGKWDVKFTSAEITNSIVEDTTANTANVNADGKSVDVSVNLATPGDGSNIKAIITNAGTVKAKIEDNGFKIEGTNGSTFTDEGNGVYKCGAVLVKVPTVADGTILDAEGTHTFEFSVEWDPTVGSLEEDQTANFKITFDYEQAGINGTFNGVQNFN